MVEEKLGRMKALGLSIKKTNTVKVDPRQDEKERLDTIVHEAIHLADWDLAEIKVIGMANRVSEILWQAGYRRVMVK